MLPQETEEEFKGQVMQLAKLRRWRLAHFRPAETRKGWRTAVEGDGSGFPDLVLVRERVVWAELKSARGVLSAEQIEWVAALEKAGQEIYVWRPADWDAIVKTLS